MVFRFDRNDPLIRQKLSNSLLGNKRRLGKPAWNKGLKLTKDQLKNYKIPSQKGEKHWNWKGGFKKKCQRRNRKRGIGLLKMRFEVLQRDLFTCQYCGRKPPEVILEIDHWNPKSQGGEYELENLKTSCRECNRGKGDIILFEKLLKIK